MVGLLDYLFNPGTYSQGGGGLLSRLQPSLAEIPQSQGFPGQASPLAVGNYQMPRIGDMAQFTPPPADPAALPPNAQPTQGQLPPPQQGGFLGAFNENLQTLGNGGSLIGALTGARPNNQTAQFLVSKGLDPALARTVVSDPGLLRAVLPQVMGMGGQTDDIKEYQFARKEDPTLTFSKFMQQKRATSGAYGMQGYWGSRNGKPALLQLGKDGVPVEVKIPEGFELARDTVKVEGPTGTTLLDPQTRQQVGFVPKDVAGAAKSKEMGEAEGQALVNLPTTIATAENTLKTIGQLENHPGKKNWGAFGVGAMFPDMPGGATRGFAALVEQVKGQNFMTAFQSLKGAGAITEQEGAKAERAQARLDRAQSEADFDVALKDLKEVIIAGMERARQKAGIKNNQAAPAPQSNVDALLKKYGGK